jgi:hypothetical protein
MVNTKKFDFHQYSSRTARKFGLKFIGLFFIKKWVRENAYKLILLSNLNFYPTLNISQLVPYRAPLEGQAGPPAKTEHTKRVDSMVVDKIVDSRYVKETMQYLVKWS